MSKPVKKLMSGKCGIAVWENEYQGKKTVSFSFDKSYSDVMNTARSEGYQIKEDEINSSYGKYSLLIEKPLTFYLERIYLFFDEESLGSN